MAEFFRLSDEFDKKAQVIFDDPRSECDPDLFAAALRAEYARGLEDAAKQSEDCSLGENIIREMIDAKVREVKLWSVCSRRIAQSIRALKPTVAQGETTNG